MVPKFPDAHPLSASVNTTPLSRLVVPLVCTVHVLPLTVCTIVPLDPTAAPMKVADARADPKTPLTSPAAPTARSQRIARLILPIARLPFHSRKVPLEHPSHAAHYPCEMRMTK